MKLFKTKPGEISKESVWVIISQGYLYSAGTLFGIIVKFVKEYKHDRHLAG